LFLSAVVSANGYKVSANGYKVDAVSANGYSAVAASVERGRYNKFFISDSYSLKSKRFKSKR
jgi:hypothetical protein